MTAGTVAWSNLLRLADEIDTVIEPSLGYLYIHVFLSDTLRCAI